MLVWSGESGKTELYSLEICAEKQASSQNGVHEGSRGPLGKTGLTCSPFSRNTRSHSRTSPATSTKSRVLSSNSTLHALTISSSVLPRSKDGTGAATAGAPAAAAGAPNAGVAAAGLAAAPPPNESAVEGAAAGVVEVAGLAPKEKVAGAANKRATR